MLTRRYYDTELRTGIDVDVRVDAALADESKFVQPMEQRRANLGPLAYQHQRFRFFEALEGAEAYRDSRQEWRSSICKALSGFWISARYFFYQSHPRAPSVRR